MVETNYLSYNGIVKLNIIDAKTKGVKNSRVIHNNGTDNLFFFLCKCLAKQYDTLLAPLAIDASATQYDEKNNNTLTTSLAYRILLSSQGVIENATIKNNEGNLESYKYMTRFSAIIPYSAILTNQNTLKCFQLHSSIAQNDRVSSLLAYINIPEGVPVSSGEALLIEWNMGFKNPDSEIAQE